MTPVFALLGFTCFAVTGVMVLVLVRIAVADNFRRVNYRRIERKLDALLDHHGIRLPCNLSPEVQQLARDPRQRIAAIKLHREQSGVSLLEAKLQVEDFAG